MLMKAEPKITITTKSDFVDIRETVGSALYSIRWASVECIEDNSEDAEPFFLIRMINGNVYVVKDPSCFNAIRDRRKDKH